MSQDPRDSTTTAAPVSRDDDGWSPRAPKRERAARSVPARSRLTVSPGLRANLTRALPLGEALRGSRLALEEMVGRIDALLLSLEADRPAVESVSEAARELGQAKDKAAAALEGVRPRHRRRL